MSDEGEVGEPGRRIEIGDVAGRKGEVRLHECFAVAGELERVAVGDALPVS
jgi:hypothetical protein